MNIDMTRSMLRCMVDPELFGELSNKPLGKFRLPNGRVIQARAAWMMFVTQTVLPLAQNQVETLRRYAELLTKSELAMVDQYADNLAEFNRCRRDRPFMFPKTPPGFEDILRD